MFELPEFAVLARQASETLAGKVVRQGSLGNAPHKFVWYNRTHEEFDALTCGKVVGQAGARAKWLFLPLDPGYLLALGECGGKVLYHPAAAPLPAKYHLLLTFEDGSAFSVTTQMWGAMELFAAGDELQRIGIRDMRPTPADPEFTLAYFLRLIDEVAQGETRSAKGLLTQEQLIPGLGNSIAQDILFRARLHPRHAIGALTRDQCETLYRAIMDTVAEVTAHGGRYDETDLFGHAGGYVRLMDKNAAGRPCPECGRAIEKTQYLGGACYYCPHCQV